MVKVIFYFFHIIILIKHLTLEINCVIVVLVIKGGG